MTQAQLAEKAGLSLRTIQSWEQGRRCPISMDFFKLVKALDVSADQFAGVAAAVVKAKKKPDAKPAGRRRKGKGE